MNIAGRVSAGTLGYIVGNVPGAVAADKLYRKYVKNLPAAKETYQRIIERMGKRLPKNAITVRISKRARTSPPSIASSSRRSRRSSVSMRSTRSSRSIAASVANIRTAAIKTKSQGVKKEGVKKKIKVPKKLRKQIKQVLKSSDHIGWSLENFSQKFTPIGFGQNCYQLGQVVQGVPNMFDPTYVAHMASCLFNDKALTSAPTLSDSGYFPLKALKVNVLQQTATFRLKNNTARTMYISLYETSPKNRSEDTNGREFFDYWRDSFVDESITGGTTEGSKLNLADTQPYTMYATPYMSPAVTANYAIDQTKIILEPGKEYIYTMNGGAREYNFSKFYRPDNFFVNEQKFCKQLMAVVYLDMVGTSLGIATRKSDMLNDQPWGLLVEQTKYMKIGMPEQTGFRVVTPVVSGQSYPNTNRKNKPYIVQDWSQQGAIGAVAVINDEVPNDPAAAGV